MEWEILHPELEEVYTNGKSKGLPTIDERIAKKITIRLLQVEAVNGISELKELRSIQLKKLKERNRYSLLIEDNVWLLVEVVKLENDEIECLHIIDLFQ